MIYAKIYAYTNIAGLQVQTIAAKLTPDTANGFLDFDVPSVNDLMIVQGAIATSNQVAATITDINQAKFAKSLEISLACKSSILQGFSSTALGASYHYPAKDTDQQNLASSILDSLLNTSDSSWTTPFWCQDSTGTWAFRPHSQAQIQQVGKDAKSQVLIHMNKNQQLQEQISACTTMAQVNSIAW